MKIEISPGADGQWYWHMKARNHKIVCDGAEGYTSFSHARRAVVKLLSTLAICGPVLIERGS